MDLKNKKVLVVTTTDNMIWQFLLPSIKLLQDAGASVECACNETGFWFNEIPERAGVTVHKIEFTRSPFSRNNLKAYKDLKNLVKQNGYDLIYCHQPIGGFMGRLVGKKFKIPVVYVAHGFHFFKGCPKKNIIYKWAEKYASKFTTALVTMNEEDYQASLKMKAKKQYKINGIGFDNNKYTIPSVEREEMRKNLGLSNEFVILTVAEMIKRKNYDTMLKTVAELKDNNIKFLICGRGEQQTEIEELIKTLGIEEKVDILGYRKDINNIMRASDVFFLPSFQEGLTLSVIEAMSFGLPCVVSTARGNKDLIEDGKGGFVCLPTDVSSYAEKFDYLMQNGEALKAMGEYNKVQSNNYSIDAVNAQLKTIFEEI